MVTVETPPGVADYRREKMMNESELDLELKMKQQATREAIHAVEDATRKLRSAKAMLDLAWKEEDAAYDLWVKSI